MNHSLVQALAQIPVTGVNRDQLLEAMVLHMAHAAVNNPGVEVSWSRHATGSAIFLNGEKSLDPHALYKETEALLKKIGFFPKPAGVFVDFGSSYACFKVNTSQGDKTLAEAVAKLEKMMGMEKIAPGETSADVRKWIDRALSNYSQAIQNLKQDQFRAALSISSSVADANNLLTDFIVFADGLNKGQSRDDAKFQALRMSSDRPLAEKAFAIYFR